jgi:sulfoacetaldehyde dehydrogenase
MVTDVQGENEKRYIQSLVERSRKAQREIFSYTQARVDELAVAIIYSLSRKKIAEKIAALALEETEMGTYEAKVAKFTDKLPMIWQDIKIVPTVGIIEKIPSKGLIKLAKPVGVIAALIPSTTAEATPPFDGVLGLRGRNSVIFAPHPKSEKTTSMVVEKMREILRLNNAPEDLFICIENPSKTLANELMKACDITFATGSKDMVRAAYSSGKPAYGVGVGNAVVIIDGTCDLAETANKISLSKTNDNASGCSAENSLVIQEKIYDDFLRELALNGGRPLVAEEKSRLQSALWVNGHINPEIVARPIDKLARLANIPINSDSKFLVVEETGFGPDYPFSGEKLSLVLTVYKYGDFQEAIDLVNNITNYSGAGHSCGIHSNDDDHIMRLALNTQTTKVIVRQPHRSANSGNWFNGLAKTFSLGCGTWGGNIVSENITQKHFINTTWVSEPIAPIGYKPYTEKEIFGDIVQKVKLLEV